MSSLCNESGGGHDKVYKYKLSDAADTSVSAGLLTDTVARVRLNMKIWVAACLLANVAARPQSDRDRDAKILRYDLSMSEDGQFQYDFETSNGIIVDAAGENRQIGDAAGMAMRGSYSYTSPEGIRVNVDWVADEEGFRAFGPQVPAVPDYVKQTLKTPSERPPASPVTPADTFITSEEQVVSDGPSVISSSRAEYSSVGPSVITSSRAEYTSTGPSVITTSRAEYSSVGPIVITSSRSEDDSDEVVPGRLEPDFEIVETEADYTANPFLQDIPFPATTEDVSNDVEIPVQEPVFDIVETEADYTTNPFLQDTPVQTTVEDVSGEAAIPVQEPIFNIVETQVEDEPAPLEADPITAPVNIPFPVDDPVPIREDVPAAAPIEDAPAPVPFADVPVPIRVEEDPVQAPVKISQPVNIPEIADFGSSAPISGTIDIAPVSSSRGDDTPDSIQDAIASALREDSSAIGAGAPRTPPLGDNADRAVPSSEFIVLDAWNVGRWPPEAQLTSLQSGQTLWTRDLCSRSVVR